MGLAGVVAGGHSPTVGVKTRSDQSSCSRLLDKPAPARQTTATS